LNRVENCFYNQSRFYKCLELLQNGECEFSWSDEFNQYYLKNIHKGKESIAAYAIKDTCGDLFNWLSGIRTNQFEGQCCQILLDQKRVKGKKRENLVFA
jgi:hypothetical protein